MRPLKRDIRRRQRQGEANVSPSPRTSASLPPACRPWPPLAALPPAPASILTAREAPDDEEPVEGLRPGRRTCGPGRSKATPPGRMARRGRHRLVPTSGRGRRSASAPLVPRLDSTRRSSRLGRVLERRLTGPGGGRKSEEEVVKTVGASSRRFELDTLPCLFHELDLLSVAGSRTSSGEGRSVA